MIFNSVWAKAAVAGPIASAAPASPDRMILSNADIVSSENFARA
jgi:hypothetical protein